MNRTLEGILVFGQLILGSFLVALVSIFFALLITGQLEKVNK